MIEQKFVLLYQKHQTLEKLGISLNKIKILKESKMFRN